MAETLLTPAREPDLNRLRRSISEALELADLLELRMVGIYLSSALELLRDEDARGT
ncbi:hypothetical protein [Novosphingobium sp. B1]|uniref:hypothetical protein n=1 Tax=Novosphingobium sp. B1 TaxID=1938756 RepID=UPI0009D8B011|nr:hypothetical protein [Novosphingobium sp. B1]SMC98377.1 hypothetical protein SAMN06272759_1168 [Novosphingobium sp. B1]